MNPILPILLAGLVAAIVVTVGILAWIGALEVYDTLRERRPKNPKDWLAHSRRARDARP